MNASMFWQPCHVNQTGENIYPTWQELRISGKLQALLSKYPFRQLLFNPVMYGVRSTKRVSPG